MQSPPFKVFLFAGLALLACLAFLGSQQDQTLIHKRDIESSPWIGRRGLSFSKPKTAPAPAPVNKKPPTVVVSKPPTVVSKPPTVESKPPTVVSQPAPVLSKPAVSVAAPASSAKVVSSAVKASSAASVASAASVSVASKVSSVSAASVSSAASVASSAVSASSVQSSASSVLSGKASKPTDKCTVEGCSGTLCGGNKRSAEEQSLEERAFTAVNVNGQVAALRLANGNRDLSVGFQNGLIDEAVSFAGGQAATMTMTQLNGCTGVYIVSSAGMYGAHILEFDDFNSNNDLSHEGFQTHLQRVATSLQTKAAPVLAGANAQLHILLPLENGQVVYDLAQPSKTALEAAMVQFSTASSRTATDKMAANLKTTQQISQAIIAHMQTAAGGLNAQIHNYNVAQITTAGIKASNRGTFVAQFDPANDNGAGTVGPAAQLFVNGAPATQRIAL